MEPAQNSTTRNYPGTKKLFWKLGTCSQTLAHIMNRELGNRNEKTERALDPLAGGIIRRGHQCGMLWGSALGAGAEAYKKCKNPLEAQSVAIEVTAELINSFKNRTKSANCRDITNCNFTNGWSMAKYMVTGGPLRCFNLADKWAPEAVDTAVRKFDEAKDKDIPDCINCASETVRQMGGNEEEQTMVAGFAGGLGLSGNGCGALAAAIWKDTIAYCEENPEETGYNNKGAENYLHDFEAFTNGELKCSEITGKFFSNAQEHSDYIKEGGCKKQIECLTNCHNSMLDHSD
jgi:hypothetical protein